MQINLQEIPILVLNMKKDDKKRAFMAGQLQARGYNFRFVEGVRCDPKSLGCALSHLKAISDPDLKPPFLVFEDDCQLIDDLWQDCYDVPDDIDALYLGHSVYGLAEQEDHYGLRWGKPKTVQYTEQSSTYIRVYNMLARHAIVYVSERYHEATRQAGLRALLGNDFTIPGDMAYAMIQPSFNVLATRDPHCFQAAEYGGIESATKGSVVEYGIRLEAAPSVNLAG